MFNQLIRNKIQKGIAIAFIGVNLTALPSFAKPLLVGAGVSPYVRKIQVALDEKQIAYDQQEILPKILLKLTKKPIPKILDETSPLGKIPALRDEGTDIADSSVIIAYLEQKYSDRKKLLPKDPKKLARVLWFQNYADNVIGLATKHVFVEKVVKPLVLKADPDQALVKQGLEKELPKILSYLEKETKGKKYIAGDQFTIADIAIASQFVSLKQAGFKVCPKKYPNFSKYLNRILMRESFKKYL